MSKSLRSGRTLASSLFLASLLAFVPSQAFAQEGQGEAQKLFDQGMAHFHNGDPQKAIDAFRKVIELAPDEAVAYQLLNQSQDKLLQLMTAGGEFETFAMEILEAASTASREAMRDADAAADAAEGCFADDLATRSKAIFDLGHRFGPYGALALVDALGEQKESRRLAAIYAMGRIGSEAFHPALAATWSDDAQVRSSALMVLAELNDPRAAARIADLAANDSDGTVRKVATQFAVKADAAEMLYAQGWDYLDGDPAYGLAGTENYGTYFKADGSGVTGVDMARALVPCELAKRCFARSLALGNADAAIALATAYATEVSILQANGEDMADQANAQIASCLTLGTANLQAALVNAVAENKVGAAMALVGMLKGTGSNDALQFALENSSATELRFHAALALGGSGQVNGPVVNALADAAGLDALRVVHLIDPSAERAARLASELGSQGIAVIRAEDGASGMINAHRSMLVDAFVIANPLPDLYASRVLKELRKDDRFADTPVLIFGAEGEEMDGAEYVEDLTASAVTDAFGDLGVDRERYLATAAAAASMLSHLSMVNADAVATVAGGMTDALGREDAVAVPAAGMIGRSGSSAQAEALMGLVADSSRSTEARTAAAKGLATLASRMDVSVSADALVEFVTDSEAAFAQACARAYAALSGKPLAIELGN